MTSGPTPVVTVRSGSWPSRRPGGARAALVATAFEKLFDVDFEVGLQQLGGLDAQERVEFGTEVSKSE